MKTSARLAGIGGLTVAMAALCGGVAAASPAHHSTAAVFVHISTTEPTFILWGLWSTSFSAEISHLKEHQKPLLISICKSLCRICER
jgi:hypothetical protein